jgi:chromosome segregation ATPase
MAGYFEDNEKAVEFLVNPSSQVQAAVARLRELNELAGTQKEQLAAAVGEIAALTGQVGTLQAHVAELQRQKDHWLNLPEQRAKRAALLKAKREALQAEAAKIDAEIVRIEKPEA